MSESIFCRLCLEPENRSEAELRFVHNLCYCRKAYLHRKCLQEWVSLSGLKNCPRCRCRYNVTMIPRGVAEYVWYSPDEWIRLMQIALRGMNVLHLTLIACYVFAFISLCSTWIPYKTILGALLIARWYLSVRKIIQLGTNLMQNYRNWKLRSFKVVLNELNY